MISKYEDALYRLYKKAADDEISKCKTINKHMDDIASVYTDVETIREALRKAESMDRLIEARKVATEGDWACGTHPANNRLNIIKPIFFGNRVTKLPECEGGHVSLKNKSDAIFIATAANETAKYIDGN